MTSRKQHRTLVGSWNAPICKTLEYTTIRDSKDVNPTYFEWKPSCPPAPRALLGDCVVCLDTQAKSVLLPCAHRCVCEKHAKACKKKAAPMCPSGCRLPMTAPCAFTSWLGSSAR